MIGIQNVLGAGGSGGPLISMDDPGNRFMGIGLDPFVNQESNVGSAGYSFLGGKGGCVLPRKFISHRR